MCGRYQRRSDKQRIAEAFALGEVEGLAMGLDLAPNYNVSPGTMQPVIVWDPNFGTRTLRMMFWRFLPPFCADPGKFKLSTTNAASQNLLRGIWKESFLQGRCLVPADTFVEWRRAARQKLPWIFAMKSGEIFGLGGIWRRWVSKDGTRQMDTFAIITVEPNELVKSTTHHDRMPLILKREDWRAWLDPGSFDQPPVALLRPFDSEQMSAWQADTAINNVRNNDPGLGTPKTDISEQSELF